MMIRRNFPLFAAVLLTGLSATMSRADEVPVPGSVTVQPTAIELRHQPPPPRVASVRRIERTAIRSIFTPRPSSAAPIRRLPASMSRARFNR